MKLLVQTSGDFGLYDMALGQDIAASRPSVVERSSFVTNQVGLGRLEILEALADEASDAPLAAARTEAELKAALDKLPRPAAPAPKSPAAKPASPKK